MSVKLPLPMLKVHIRQGSGPKGPLTAREIKDRVTAEYEQVSVTRHNMQSYFVIAFTIYGNFMPLFSSKLSS